MGAVPSASTTRFGSFGEVANPRSVMPVKARAQTSAIVIENCVGVVSIVFYSFRVFAGHCVHLLALLDEITIIRHNGAFVYCNWRRGSRGKGKGKPCNILSTISPQVLIHLRPYLLISGPARLLLERYYQSQKC
jgi:hypothetical protein